MTWLIAEDEADIRMLVGMMCQVWGHNTLMFENGQKAWDWLDQVEKGTQTGPLPEFALMDIRMPGKKGNELANRMRTIPALQKLPIVLMTAFSLNDAERTQMMDVDGVDHIISKPLPDFDDLKKTLEGVAERKKATTTT